MSDLPKQLRIKAGMINMGERIAWGSDSALMGQAADLIEQQQARIAELEQREQELTETVERLRNIASDLAKHPDGTRGNDAREAWCYYEHRLKENPNE